MIPSPGRRWLAIVPLAALLGSAGCDGPSRLAVGSPTPTRGTPSSETPTASPTPSVSPTASSTPSPTATSPTLTPTPTPSPSASPAPSSTPTATTPPLPAGLQALVDLDSLCLLRPPGLLVEQISSYDRGGGNTDLGIGPDTAELMLLLGIEPMEVDHSYLYREGDRYVIFDEMGPGVVYRIWMTGLDSLFRGGLGGDVAFEIDGEDEPRLVLTRAELFAGERAPFITPLAGDNAASAGGFYSVLPIPYARRLRITTSTVPNWLQITFARLPPEQAVESFDPLADTSEAAAILASAGTDPKRSAPTLQAEIALAVAAGGSQVVWEREGAGAVLRLELQAPAGAEIPGGLRLQAHWDGAAEPQVDAPLDDLFAAGLGPAARSFALGRDGDRFYLYFAMPFRSGARIVLRNDGASAFEGWALRIGAIDEPPQRGAAFFHARARAVRQEADGDDYVLLDTAGTGHVVAVVMNAGCAEEGQCQLAQLPGFDGAHLEGDEHVSVDGSRYPQIHGTGLEDFFNGGFYFLGGPVNLPTHGNPAQPATSARRPGLNLRGAYRLFLGDAIPFSNQIRLAIEHGPMNDVPAEMSSLVLYYAIAAPTLIETDRITIGIPASESAHALSAEGRGDRVLRSAFRGDESDVEVERAGIEARRTSFRVAVDPANRGVRLRRLADIALGRQSADVLVDDRPAGTWYTPDVNPILRWADLDFELPASLTAGRDSLEVTLDAAASPAPWTAFEYVVFSYVAER